MNIFIVKLLHLNASIMLCLNKDINFLLIEIIICVLQNERDYNNFVINLQKDKPLSISLRRQFLHT